MRGARKILSTRFGIAACARSAARSASRLIVSRRQVALGAIWSVSLAIVALLAGYWLGERGLRDRSEYVIEDTRIPLALAWDKLVSAEEQLARISNDLDNTNFDIDSPTHSSVRILEQWIRYSTALSQRDAALHYYNLLRAGITPSISVVHPNQEPLHDREKMRNPLIPRLGNTAEEGMP